SFRVKVFLKNTVTMRWFANKSLCLGPKMALGTDLERDRDSAFYAEELEGWEASNRVAMDQFRTNPGEIASFTFWGKAGNDPDIIKEYFTPVLKDIEWLNGAQFSFEVMIGDTGESASDLRKKISYANESGSVQDIDLNAEKVLIVDLSEQNLYVKLGDHVIRQTRVSTGAAATPTPVGETKLILKQEVRVGVKPPHYIMPYFQMFRAGGYGFHALPSLGRANSGVFWTEARNHIGIPVSHGCIRLLPEDAEWLF
ncbi:MAG: L,D-transpeptidase, partial [Chloroflexota bacterium]